jgi:drug/metabolite transporter (DMT)-like permease
VLERWTEVSGLLAAICWSIGGVAFSRIPASADALNLGKNICGASLLACALLLGAGAGGILALDGYAFLWLSASGVVGILLGDRSYLRALQLLGARRALLFNTLVPIFAAALGWCFLAEALAAGQLAAIAVTIVGVAIVIRERSPGPRMGSPARPGLAGILHGANGALCQAVGAALTKKGMAGALGALEASAVRLAVAAAAGVAVAIVTRRARRWTAELAAPGVPARLIFASSIGTFLGIWLSVIAIESLSLAIASTQTAMTPIFGTILVAAVLGERVSVRACLGTAVAFGGVLVLILGRA